MIELKLQENSSPFRSIKGAVELLESLEWYLSYKEVEGRIVLFRGDGPILSTDCRDALYAFVVGAALAYESLPSPMFEQFKANRDSSRHPRHIFPGLTPLQK
jgi:hypothetical protein